MSINEYREIAFETCEQIKERRMKLEEISKKETFFGNLQYKYILWKAKRAFEKGKFSTTYEKGGLGFYYKHDFPKHNPLTAATTLYVIDKLENDGFMVKHGVAKNSKWRWLFAIEVPVNEKK